MAETTASLESRSCITDRHLLDAPHDGPPNVLVSYLDRMLGSSKTTSAEWAGLKIPL
jgi:hypothetical protein